MKVDEEKKHEYWNHFVAKIFTDGPKQPGVTGPRLRKIKSIIWADEDFWFDILYRHGGENMTPEQMLDDGARYAHCSGNFWGMICQTLVEKGSLKGGIE